MNLKQLYKHKVVKSGVSYIFSNLLVKGLGFISIPIFTRILTTGDYGKVSLYTTYVSILAVIISLDLAQSVQLGKIDYEDDFDNFVSSIALLSFLLFLIFFIILILFIKSFSRILEIESFLYLIMIFQAYLSFVKQFMISKLTIQYKYNVIALLSISVSILSILLSVYLIQYVFIGKEYYGKIIGGAVFPSLIGVFVLIYFLVKGKNLINFEYWKAALAISLPFVFHNLSGIINAQFDRIVINNYFGATPTGEYSFAYNIAMLITVVWYSMNSAFNPYFYEKMKTQNFLAVKLMCKGYRDLFSLAYVIILFISPEIVKIMAPKSYWAGLNIVPWIFLALFFQVLISFESKIEYAYKKTYLTPIGTTVSAIINIVLNILFVPIYGYEAAAITTVISYVVLFLYHYFITKYVIKVTFYGFLFHLKAIAIAASATALFFVFKETLLIRILITLAYIVYYGVIMYYLLNNYKRVTLED